MKYLKLSLTGVLFVFFNSVFAQQHNSLLWEISGNGLEQPSYLFGTIHTICPEELELSPKILNALEKSEQLVLELDMDDTAFLQKIQQLSVNEELKNISTELSDEDLNTLNTFLKKHYQADMSSLGILKPFALLSMVFIKSLDCPQPGSYEQALMELSIKQDWEIYGLESIQDQFAIFDGVPKKEQLGWLVKYAADEEHFRNGVSKMVSAYKNEEINQLLNLMTDYPEYKIIEEALLYDRNVKWITPIIKHASDKPTFFAVGAAHLASDRGLIKLLQEKGFQLTPITQ